jgi:hypothetical protein
LIAELAETSRLPTVYSWREGVEAGSFMAYAFEIVDLFRHNADIIAKILAGAKPSDIPFYQARKFELSFNLKTANVLGIKIPDFLLAVADEVIERQVGEVSFWVITGRWRVKSTGTCLGKRWRLTLAPHCLAAWSPDGVCRLNMRPWHRRGSQRSASPTARRSARRRPCACAMRRRRGRSTREALRKDGAVI